jgi:chromosome segregation ATPase
MFALIRWFFALVVFLVQLFPMVLSLAKLVMTCSGRAARKALMKKIIQMQKAAASHAKRIEQLEKELKMEKQKALDLIAAAKVVVVEQMDKLASDVAALDDVPPTDDEEKAQLKAKVAELEVAVAAKSEELAAAKVEIVSKDELLKSANLLAKQIDAAIPDEAAPAPVEG